MKNRKKIGQVQITLGSLFDGIGGFPLAAERNGITPLWASEIETFPMEVTKTRFPGMRHVGDITQLAGANLPPVDIITGGSPCQDLSVAGRRAGLEGERSGLFMEQVRVTKELRYADEQRGRTALLVRPRYFIWENVPGAFSSGTPNGEDFRVVLEEICRIVDGSVSVPRPQGGAWESAGAILGEGFSLAWRVFDAQYWSVPQRRKRIFLVADFGGFSAPKILFEQDRLLGDSAPGKGTGQEAAACAGMGAADPGGAGKMTAFACNQRDEVRDLRDVAAAVCASHTVKQQTFVADTSCLTPWNTQQKRIFTEGGVAPTLAGADGGGGRNPAGLLFSAGFCAGASPTAGNIGYQDECAPTLKAGDSGTNMVPSILCLNDQGGQRMDISVDTTGTLRAAEKGHQPVILFEHHGQESRYTGPQPTLPTVTSAYDAGGGNTPMLLPPLDEPDSYCISGNIMNRKVENGGNHMGFQANISYTLNTCDRHAVFSRQRVDIFTENDVVATQSARQYKDATDLVLERRTPLALLIRRLTPLECERLQGFPDFWTLVAGASDSARFKALGNSVAVPCVEYVLRGVAYYLRQQYAA